MALDFPSAPAVGQQYQGYVWDGTKWDRVIAGGLINRYAYIAVAGQSVFSGADISGNVLAYTPGGVETVINGFMLAQQDFTATNGTSITTASPCAAGDLVYVQVFTSFALVDALQKTLNGSDILSPATFRSNLGFGLTTGKIGEQKTVSIGATLTSGVPAMVGSLSLEAGTWEVEAYNSFGGPGVTTSSDWWTVISTVSGSSTGVVVAHTRRPSGADISEWHVLPRTRVSPAVTTTYYCNAIATFATSTYSCSGLFTATRVA